MKFKEGKGTGITLVVVGILCAVLAVGGIITGQVISDKNSTKPYSRSEDSHDFWLQVGLLSIGSVIATGKGIIIIKKAKKRDSSKTVLSKKIDISLVL